jgi:hypothetical protein
MYAGASRAGYRLVLGVGRILVVSVEGVLNVQVGIRTDEDEWSHRHFAAASDLGIPLCFSVICSR